MEKQKIYLSGKITGAEGFAEKFRSKEAELTERGDYVFNPALHPDMFTHGQFMQIDLLALSFCDSIYLMDNWRDSKGAIMEFEQARALGIPCEFEEKDLCLLRHYEGGKEEIPTYYSDKKGEFVDLEDITADDFFDSKREAEEKVWSALDWDNGNVQVVSAEEIFGNKKDISPEQAIKNEKDISKVQSAVQAALEKNAVPFSKTEPLDEDDMARLRIYGTIETTRGTLRLSEIDRKIFSKSKLDLNAIAATLRNPDIVFEKKAFNEKEEEFKPTIEIFGKNFRNKEGKTSLEVIYRNREIITVGNKFRNLSQFVKLIKSTDEISYLDKRISEAVARSLRGGASREHSQDEIGSKAEKSSSEKKKVSLDLKNLFETTRFVSLDLGNLFNTLKKENNYEPTTLIESGKPYDYLVLSAGNKIRHSVDDGIDYYDLISFADGAGIVCMDGETCELIRSANGAYVLKQEDSDITFALSAKELEIATQKISLAKSPVAEVKPYAPEVFLDRIQKEIARNHKITDRKILQTAKKVLFDGQSAEPMKAGNADKLGPGDFSPNDRKEIKEALKALGAGSEESLIEIIKTTNPKDVRLLMNARRQHEEKREKSANELEEIFAKEYFMPASHMRDGGNSLDKRDAVLEQLVEQRQMSSDDAKLLKSCWKQDGAVTPQNFSVRMYMFRLVHADLFDKNGFTKLPERKHKNEMERER